MKVPSLDEKALLELCKQSAEDGVYFDDSVGVEDWIIPLPRLKEWLCKEDYDALTKENG